MRVNKVLKKVLGLDRRVVIRGWDLTGDDDTSKARPALEVRVRRRVSRRGPCGRCGASAPWYDQGDGERRWRHIDVGYATCQLVADAPRVDCPEHGPTVVAFPFARHDSASGPTSAVLHPAASAVWASRSSSPMKKMRVRSRWWSRCAWTSMPGAGLRQAQPSSHPCGQW